MQQFTKYIVVSGRNDNENGVVHIQNIVYKGFGYFDKNQKSNFTVAFKTDTKDARRILMRYLIMNDLP